MQLNKRVRLFSDWADSKNLVNRLISQTLQWPSGIDFVTDDSYDHAVIFNYTTEEIFTAPEKNIGLVLEPPEIVPQMFSDGMIEYSRTLADYYSFAQMDGYKFAPGLGFAQVAPFNAITPSNKPLNACIISSDKLMTPYHHKRREVFDALTLTDLELDFYGRGLGKRSCFRSPRNKGEIPNMGKREVLQKYKYVIDFENSPTGVVTDKYFDPILCNCMPVSNTQILDEIAVPGAYRLVDFELPTDVIVEEIKRILNEPVTQMDNISIMQQKLEVMKGTMSLVHWIADKVKEL